MSAEEFLLQTSPNDNAGIREKLNSMRMRNVITNLMDSYAAQQTQSLQEEVKRLKESLNKIDNLIGNYMHNDWVKIGTLVLDIQEIVVKT